MKLRSSVLLLAAASVPAVTSIHVDSLEPRRVGLEGGARITITGKDLGPAGRGQDPITVGGAPCIPSRMYSDVKDGKFCVCELPPLPVGEHSVAVGGVTSPTLSVSYQKELTPEASVVLSTLVGAAGDTLLVVGQNWNIGSYPSYQIRATVGGHVVRPDEHSSIISRDGKGNAIFHVTVPHTLAAGHYSLDLIIDRRDPADSEAGGRVRWVGADAPKVRVVPQVNALSHKVSGIEGGAELNIVGSGFGAETQVAVGGRVCHVTKSDRHLLSCTIGAEETKEKAEGMERRARAAETAKKPRGAVLRVHQMTFAKASECVQNGGDACARIEQADDEHLVITDSLSWPKVHPLRAAERQFRWDYFAASGRAMMTAPVTGAYEFSARCPGGSDACGVEIDGKKVSGERVQMQKGATVPLHFWLVHADHGTRLEVDVTIYPDPASGLPAVVEVGPVPGDWLSHHAEDEGWGGDAAVHVDEHSAWLRPTNKAGASLSLLHKATAQVHGCELSTKRGIGAGVDVICHGEGLNRGHVHNHEGPEKALRQHDPPHVMVGDATGCRAERGQFNATYMRCRVPSTANVCGEGPAPLRVWIRGSGWARMHTPINVPRFPCPAKKEKDTTKQLAPARRAEGLNNPPCLNKCQGGGDCVIEAGEVFLLCQSIDVRTLTIRGELRWDTSQGGLELRTGWAVVEQNGYFQLGLPEAPMMLPATIYIKNNGATHGMQELEKRFFAGVGGGARIDVHGAPMARTWSLLKTTAHAGEKILYLKDDPEMMGWKAGDRVGIAATSHSHGSGTDAGSMSSHRTIARVGEADEWLIPASGEVTPGPFNCDSLALGHCCLGGQNCGGWTCPAAPNENSACDVSRGAGNMADGDLGTRFYIRDSGAGDLNIQDSLVSRVRLFFHDKHEASVKVKVGDYDSQHQTVNAQEVGTFPAYQKGWQEIEINPPVQGRRVVVEHNGGGQKMVILEAQILGKEVGAPKTVILELDQALDRSHYGGVSDVEGESIEMAAEIINLDRNVVITGDDFTQQQGWHMIQANGGQMRVSYTRAEKCGQRDILGRYCLHWHVVGDCPGCMFKGNAIEDSEFRGIQIHGVHNALIDQNVMWDVRCTGIYTEDGNEVGNKIQRNVMMCTNMHSCRCGGIGSGETGIYLVGMNNDLIENRVIQYRNTIFSQGSGHQFGDGPASGKVCTEYIPFGTIAGNVGHDTVGFGIYLDNQYPRNVVQDQDGYVVGHNAGGAWYNTACSPFKTDGSDNGKTTYVQDHLDYHHTFVGQYNVGDVTFVRYDGVNVEMPMYWKKSKNSADGHSAHVKDSRILHGGPQDLHWGQVLFRGPSGPFTFVIENTKFFGQNVNEAVIATGQHCGVNDVSVTNSASNCNADYLLINCEFRHPDGKRRFAFSSSGSNEVPTHYAVIPGLDQYNAITENGKTYQSLVSHHLTGFGNVAISSTKYCEKGGWTLGNGYACMGLAARHINVWGEKQSYFTVSGPGYEGVSGEWNYKNTPYDDRNNGNGKGYGFVVLAGQEYTINGLQNTNRAAVEFSSPILGHRFNNPESVTINFAGPVGQCTLSSQDSRAWIGGRKGGPYYAKPVVKTCANGDPNGVMGAPDPLAPVGNTPDPVPAVWTPLPFDTVVPGPPPVPNPP
eukprot:Hpha_TRINITY_DN15474_c0_g7::TRINITY_DN15474_c0_g7_i1::g.173755::m.173755